MSDNKYDSQKMKELYEKIKELCQKYPIEIILIPEHKRGDTQIKNQVVT